MSEPVGNAPRGEFPGNTHKDREPQKPPADARQKIEKVVEGKVITHKTPWYRRAMRGMIADDAQSIGDFLLLDVIVPASKNLIRDIIFGGTERALYGNVRTSRSHGSILGGGGRSLRTKYDQMGDSPRQGISREERERHDFGNITLVDRAEAIIVIEELMGLVAQYKSASVGDLYSLLGQTGTHADLNWGWTDLREAEVRQTRDGYLLVLPRPQSLRR